VTVASAGRRQHLIRAECEAIVLRVSWRLSLAAALALLAIGTGGCGSGSGTVATRTSVARATSRQAGALAADERFIARADLICRRVLTQLNRHKLANASFGELARATPPRVAIENQGLSDLSRLQPPATLAADWHQMLGYMRSLANELDALGKAGGARDRSAIRKLVASKARLHGQLRTAAKRAGFSDCQQV
jgi:hypothetical protein